MYPSYVKTEMERLLRPQEMARAVNAGLWALAISLSCRRHCPHGWRASKATVAPGPKGSVLPGA